MSTPSASLPVKRKPTSATALKAAASCSLAYYYERILRLPSKQWPRTIIGVLAHSIFEALRNPRHRKTYDIITAPPKAVDYRLSPSLARLVRTYQRKYQIEDSLLADLNGMLYVGLKLIDFHWEGADRDPATGAPITYGPEHEFLLVLDDGTEIKGFIDDMAQVGGTMIIRDFKSQRNRFTINELQNNIQAFIYQLFVWQRFGLAAKVEFIMLRHPPTSRTPMKYLQVVEPISQHHMAGLMEYVKAMAPRVAGMTYEEALLDVETDTSFCQRVCTHYAPHPYWLVCRGDDPDGASPLSRHLSLDKAREAVQDGGSSNPNLVILERHHDGCAARWRG